MEDPMIEIPQSVYDQLVSDSDFLEALHSIGVDGWTGYEAAQKAYIQIRAESDDE